MNKSRQPVIGDVKRLEHSDAFVVTVYSQDGIDEPIAFMQQARCIGYFADDGKEVEVLAYRFAVVEEGAVVENSIILQNVRVCSGAHLSGAIIDKNVVISENAQFRGDEYFPTIVEKRNIYLP